MSRSTVLRRPAVTFGLVGLGALVVGLLVWTPLPPGIWHDDGVYLMLGRALLHGAGLRYVGVPGDPAAPKFPPVYPAAAAFAGLALRRRWRTAATVALTVAVGMTPWAIWSARAGAALPEPLLDLLGPYGAWLGGQIRSAPGVYVAALPALASGMARHTL